MANYTPEYDAGDVSEATISGVATMVIVATSFASLIILVVLLGLFMKFWKKNLRR